MDYYNHLVAKELADNIGFCNLTELWLKGGHYK
ncbi:glucuronate isomerase [Spiroplasma mirum]